MMNTSHEIYSLWAKPIKTTEDLHDTLVELGWKIENQVAPDINNLVSWCAYLRAPSNIHCECNERSPQFIITPYDFAYHKATSVEVSIIGEANGEWWDLKCYTVPIDKVIPSLPKICTGLLAAWEALPRRPYENGRS